MIGWAWAGIVGRVRRNASLPPEPCPYRRPIRRSSRASLCRKASCQRAPAVSWASAPVSHDALTVQVERIEPREAGDTLLTLKVVVILAGAGGDGTLWVWRLGSPGGPPRPLQHVHVAELEVLAFSPDRELLATAGRGRIDLWQTKDLIRPGATPSELHPGGARIRTLTFSAGGKWLAAGTIEDSTLVWDLAERALIESQMTSPAEGGGLLAFGAQGSSIATADSYGRVKLWDLAASPAAPLAASPLA